MSAQEFLDLYKQMEALLDEKYGEAAGRRGNAVTRFINEPAGREYRDELDLCREVRNLLTHNPDMEGRPVVEPAPALLKTLRKAIGRLQAPPSVLQFATPIAQMLVAAPSQSVYSVMTAMEERGFSHIPIVSGKRILGVFSVSTLFSYQLEYPERTMNLMHARISDFEEFTAIQYHTCERFAFMKPTHTYWDAQKAFEESSSPRKKRLAAIFITDTGDENGRLLGILTPWDVIGQEEISNEESGRYHKNK